MSLFDELSRAVFGHDDRPQAVAVIKTSERKVFGSKTSGGADGPVRTQVRYGITFEVRPEGATPFDAKAVVWSASKPTAGAEITVALDPAGGFAEVVENHEERLERVVVGRRKRLVADGLRVRVAVSAVVEVEALPDGQVVAAIEFEAIAPETGRWAKRVTAPRLDLLPQLGDAAIVLVNSTDPDDYMVMIGHDGAQAMTHEAIEEVTGPRSSVHPM